MSFNKFEKMETPKQFMHGMGIAVVIAILDQLSKWLMVEHVLHPESGLNIVDWFLNPPVPYTFTSIEVTSFFNLVLIWNQGVSFGLFDGVENAPYILAGVAVIIILIFMVWLASTMDKMTALALGLIIGGAIGNVIDRLRFGGVIDFLDFHINDMHYPAFNLGDSCITIGVILVIIGGFLKKSSEK